MVRVVCTHSKDRQAGEGDLQEGQIETRVVQRGHRATDHEKQKGSDCMAGDDETTDQEEAEKMIVFAQDKLDRMNIDRIVIASDRHNLPVMMFVY